MSRPLTTETPAQTETLLYAGETYFANYGITPFKIYRDRHLRITAGGKTNVQNVSYRVVFFGAGDDAITDMYCADTLEDLIEFMAEVYPGCDIRIKHLTGFKDQEYFVPLEVHIGRDEDTKRLYTLEDKRNAIMKECAKELAKIHGHSEGEYWTKTVPQALYDVMNSYDVTAATVACIGFLQKLGITVILPDTNTQ